MSLLHPTLGEMFDRSVLLAYKISVCQELGREHAHFQAELDELTAVIGDRAESAKVTYGEELLKIHRTMFRWIGQAEEGKVISATRLQGLNRRRIAIREEIDKLSGEYKGPERL